VAVASLDRGDGGEGRQGLADKASTLEVELEDMCRCLGIERVRVLFNKCLGELVRVVREVVVEELYDLQCIVGLFVRLYAF
jgi:hypothetical protein